MRVVLTNRAQRKLLVEGNVGHSIPEVYSHDFYKWIMLDADMNVHYELDWALSIFGDIGFQPLVPAR